jgi:hypothetical protein
MTLTEEKTSNLNLEFKLRFNVKLNSNANSKEYPNFKS